MTSDLFKPPLSTAKLKEILARHPGDVDVKALLWEIKRFRAMALRADQLVKMTADVGGAAGMVREALRMDLAGEPVIEEMQAIERGRVAPSDNADQ